jgi:hypothetical protein
MPNVIGPFAARWRSQTARLPNWQGQKAGTIEALHDGLKNGPAGLMPCGAAAAPPIAALAFVRRLCFRLWLSMTV